MISSSIPGRVSKPRGRRQQRGAALILALVVVSIVTVLAVSQGNDALVNLRRAQNQLHGKQAYAYMQGAEGLLRSFLQEDREADTKIDHKSEGWLDTSVEFPLADGQGAISGRVCDLQGRLNLNNLATSGGQGAGKPQFTPDQEVFVRLLLSLPLEQSLDQQEAEEIANAVVDWLDRDDNTRPDGGAENSYYGDLETPLRSASRTLHSVSELRWVKGITNEIYTALEPHVTALPSGTQININTAGALLVGSINKTGVLQPLTPSVAEGIVEARDGEGGEGGSGFETVADFVSEHPEQKLDFPMAVDSAYFLLDTTTIFMDRKYKLYSVLYRESDGTILTVARGKNGLGKCIDESES